MASVLCALLGSTAISCNRQKVDSRALVEETQVPASVLSMADARLATQLVSGFYPVEDQSWRWTARQFAVALRTPSGAGRAGAMLELNLYVPPVVIEKLKAVTLSANVNGAALAPETYAQSGKFVYKREVPASALAADAVQARFALDKSIPPQGNETRDLGIVALSVGLESR